MKSKRLLIPLGIFIAASIAALLTNTPSESDLLQHAQVVATVDNESLLAGSTTNRGPFVDGYEWLDDHLMLRYVCPANNPGYGSPFVQNVDTGAMTPFVIPRSVSQGQLVSVAPGGKWLLWNDLLGMQGHPVATSVDGLQITKWKVPYNSLGMTWMPDGKRWVVVTATDAVHTPGVGALSVYNLVSANPVHRAVINLSPTAGVAGFLGNDKVIIRDNFDSGFSPTEYADGKPYMLHAVDITGVPSLNASQIDLPVHVPKTGSAQSGSATISPQGDRILWYFRYYDNHRIVQLKNWLTHSSSSSISVYVTDIHGDYRHKIGTIKESKSFMTAMPKWCPDGRHISFGWMDKIYRVATP